MAKLRAGAANSNVTPPLGISINGYMQDRLAAYIHDDLHARCVVLDDGNEQLAIVTVDSCMIPRLILDAAKELALSYTDLPLDRILISATHSHSCPTVASIFQSDADGEYSEFLAHRIADGIRRAAYNLAPAKVGWGVGSVPQHVFNRRWKMKPGMAEPNPVTGEVEQVQMNPRKDQVEPVGPVDPQLSILAVQSADGKPLYVLGNYCTHFAGNTGSGHISADYFGEFSRRLSFMLNGVTQDPPVVVAMSNGTSGNVNTLNSGLPHVKSQYYEGIKAAGEDCAREALRIYNEIQFRDDVTLDMRESLLTLRRRLPRADEIAKAEYVLSQGEGELLKSKPEIYARETLLLQDFPPTVETIVQAIRIGECGIVTSPCETFVETGLAIKEQSPLKPTFVIELANDYQGYIPVAEAFEQGGYETWRARSSCLEVDSEAKLRARMLELLNQLAKDKG